MIPEKKIAALLTEVEEYLEDAEMNGLAAQKPEFRRYIDDPSVAGWMDTMRRMGECRFKRQAVRRFR